MKILKNSHGQCHRVSIEIIEYWPVHIYVKPNHFLSWNTRLRKGILKESLTNNENPKAYAQ